MTNLAILIFNHLLGCIVRHKNLKYGILIMELENFAMEKKFRKFPAVGKKLQHTAVQGPSVSGAF